jgi:hypothetical protein
MVKSSKSVWQLFLMEVVFEHDDRLGHQVQGCGIIFKQDEDGTSWRKRAWLGIWLVSYSSKALTRSDTLGWFVDNDIHHDWWLWCDTLNKVDFFLGILLICLGNTVLVCELLCNCLTTMCDLSCSVLCSVCHSAQQWNERYYFACTLVDYEKW